MKFFPRDWNGDPDLRALSYAARGLWTEMLCIMFLSPRPGFLVAGGKPLVTAAEIARNAGGHPGETARLLTELERASIFSRDAAGVIYSRRMVRDIEAMERKRTFGRKGGNPALLNHPDNREGGLGAGEEDKLRNQKPEAENGKHTHTPGASAGTPPSLEEVQAEAAACGKEPGEDIRFWHYWEQRHWRGKDGLPLDWRNNLRVWSRKDPRGRGASAKPGKRQRWQIKAEIQATQNRIEQLKADRENWKDQFGVMHKGDKVRPEAQRQLERERRHLAKLQREFDAAIEPEATA